MPEDRPPDFLYVGTSKAGSTWLFNALSRHPEVHLASDKGLYYFDPHYDRGEPWYLAQFAGRGDSTAVGEISHSYLSSPEAPARIAALNPGMRLLVCLREPVDRAFSDYLDLRKNDQFDGTFEEAVEAFPRLLDRGRYATHLRRYLEHFPREALLVQLFDDLRADAQQYADDVYAFLGVAAHTLPPAQLRSRMPAGTPRNAALARGAKVASHAVRRAGLRRLRSRVKRSVAVRQVLYRPFAAEEKPVVDPRTGQQLREHFADEVRALDGLVGRPVARQWGYAGPATG